MLGQARSRDPTGDEMVTTHPMAGGMFAHAADGITIGENRHMHMAVKVRRWTRADLERLPDDGNRYEVVRGELFVSPAPAVAHQRLVLAIVDRLRRYIDRVGIGEVDHAPSAVVIDESEVQPDVVVRPRVAVPPAKWDDMPRPILVVEILSESTRLRDMKAKRSLYLGAGIEEYWIVDGAAGSIRVIAKDSDVVLAERLSWRLAEASEEMQLDIAALFAEALGPADSSLTDFFQ